MNAPGHVHFVGVGGTGMGSLAGLLRARGVRVTGSDRELYPPMSTALARWGIEARRGFDPEHVLADPPDLVVIGNVVRPDNPEARAAIDAGLSYRSFPDALFELAIAGRHPVVVAGTHGKTTVTSLVAWLLVDAGRDPSVLVGGIAENLGGSFREGNGPHFVVEGDEYDTAFFDKTPKFLHYGARTLVVTSVEFDHADIYRDAAHLESAFRELVAGLPEDGAIVAAAGHVRVGAVVAEAPCQVLAYGAEARGPGALGAARIRPEPSGTRFDVVRDGVALAEAWLPLHGRMNVENALGALTTVEALGVPLARAVQALAGFRGVRRRQEVRGEARGVTVIDDFAHHPTAVRETLAAVRARFPGRRLIAVFEPRSNTSRRAIFQQAYVEALGGADRVIVCEVPDAPIYSATGEVTELLSAERLARDLRERGRAAAALPGVPEILEALVAEHAPGDVVLVMSNGDFGNLWERLLERLRPLEDQ